MHRFFDHITKPLLDLLPVRSILMIGADAGGRHIESMAAYCMLRNCSLTVIEPFQQFDVRSLEKRYGTFLTLLKGSSLDVMTTLPPFDVVLIDGDHNYSTVHRELSLIYDTAKRHGAPFPIVFVHNTGWPLGRRDQYRMPDVIPASERHVYAAGGLIPSSPTLLPETGLDPLSYHAVTEGGPKNGVLTAVEDFVNERSADQDFQLNSIGGFHGLTILMPRMLTQENDSLRKFFASLPMQGAATTHIAALEHARIGTHITAETFRRSLRRERQKAERSIGIKWDLEYRIRELENALNHMQDTLSWHITKPLRHLGSALKVLRQPSSWCQQGKKQWIRMGSPFPVLFRWLRHDMLGRVFPATPSEEQITAGRVQGIQSAHPRSAVSVIVTARNNGLYLRECLTSILAQSVLPLEIIYCDDGSTDDSVSIASSFPAVRILAREHRGVVDARNAAVAASRGDFLLHVDGDDLLTPDFLAEHLHALRAQANAVIAYGPTQKFGYETMYHPAQPWNVRQLWTENYINSSALIRRSAFDAVGGWQDSCGTLWDWDLWLRIARVGTGAVSKGLLLYRRHDSSWATRVRRELPSGNIDDVLGRARRAVANISVCAIIGGRLPTLFPKWIDGIAESIKAYTGTSNKPELVILDNSDGGCAAGIIHQALARHPDVFRSVLILPYPQKFIWRTEMERRHRLSIFLARAYNRLQAIADGDILWYLEDDVVVPPSAFGRLLTLLTNGVPPPAAVSGLYHNRHNSAYIGHQLQENGHPASIVPVLDEVLEIDLGGTGCLMVLRPVAPYTFDSHWRGRSPAHDWTWCQKARQEGQKILLDTSVRCRHYKTEKEWV